MRIINQESQVLKKFCNLRWGEFYNLFFKRKCHRYFFYYQVSFISAIYILLYVKSKLLVKICALQKYSVLFENSSLICFKYCGLVSSKDQIISEIIFVTWNFPKNQQNFFKDFCPSLKNSSHKKIKAHYHGNYCDPF